jgi:predicted alpha/beta-fold hydrolase
VQRQKLLKHEEQEEYYRKASAEKVLQKLQASYAAQGDKGIT